MIRVLHLTDLHVRSGRRLPDQIECLARIRAMAQAMEPDLVLLTGDLSGHEAPHRTTPDERAVLVELLDDLALIAPIVITMGNHDDATDVSALRFIGGAEAVPADPCGKWPVYVSSRAELLDVETPAGTVGVLSIPYPSRQWLLSEGLQIGQDSHTVACDNLRALLRTLRARLAAERAGDPAKAWLGAAHVHTRGGVAAGGEVLRDREIEIDPQELADMPVDFLALGHLHVRQQAGSERCWYGGSPWPTKQSERGPKGVHVVDVHAGTDAKPWPGQYDVPLHADAERVVPAAQHHVGPRLHGCTVRWVDTGARRRVSLDYRWAPADGSATPSWTRSPSEAELAAVPGAIVRLRLVVPVQYVAGCPWEQEQARVRALGPHDVVVDRTIVEPRERVRESSRAVADADSVPDKLAAYWATLATQPNDAEREAALSCWQALQAMDDDTIAELGV